LAKLFITGTDTGVGKSWVTRGVIASLLAAQKQAVAVKPVVCGANRAGGFDDLDQLMQVQQIANPDRINCYRFAQTAAPSQAAASAGESIDPKRLIQWCRSMAQAHDHCVIEGIGGLMVPLTPRWLVADWIEALADFQLWLVVGCRLGAINQTLLTLTKLQQMQRQPSRIIFNATTRENEAWIAPVRQAVEPFVEHDCQLLELPYAAEVSDVID